MWLCECRCGQRRVVAKGMLKFGISQSCGCMEMPRGELWIREFLDKNGIPYRNQKTFEKLTGVGGKLLSYDFSFVINGKEFLVEYQGEQHYRPVKWFGGNDRFEVQKEHDKRKYEYAKLHGIPLLAVPYTVNTYEDIEKELQCFIQFSSSRQAVEG